MKPLKRLRLLLAGLAIGTFAALLIAPATRWIVREQAVNIFKIHADWAAMSERMSDEAGRRHPNDYQIQLAAAIIVRDETIGPANMVKSHDAQMLKIDALRPRFPNNPSLYANLLRVSAGNGFVEFRDPHLIANLKSFSKDESPFATVSLADQLAVFDRDAAMGERLDPENAYFPLMRAAGLFTAHRDSEALAALHRAAGKPNWQDFHGDTITGQWRLQQDVSGTNDAVVRQQLLYQSGFYDYFALGFTSRFAAGEAVKAETSGQTEAGWAIRKDLMRCSGLIRTHSTSYYNTVYASGFVKNAMYRPGGAPGLKYQSGFNSERVEKALLHNFVTYLERTGRGKEIAPIEAEYAAHQKIRSLYTDSAAINQLRINELPQLWAIDLLVLGNCIWLFVAGGIAFFLAKNRRIQTEKAMSRYGAWGVVAGVLLGMSIPLCMVALKHPSDPAINWLLGKEILIPAMYLSVPFLGLSLAAFFPVGLGSFRDRTLRYLGIFVLTLVNVLLIEGLVFLEARGATTMITSFQGLSYVPNPINDHSQLFLHCAGCAVALLILTVLIGFVVSRKRGIPLSVGLTRTFKSLSIPLACVTLLIYGGMVLVTVQAERRANYDLDRQIQNEGKYRAELIGQPWPGPTNWDAAN